MPPPLPDELVEEVLLRFPPENPAGLVHAALVCRRWRRHVSDPGFRRRFRKFHRRPPMLGMLCNAYASSRMGSALVGNALYFGNVLESTALKYDLELCQASLIRLPSLWPNCWSPGSSMLTTTEDGGLGLVTKDDSKLYMWSMKDTHEVDNAIWERRVIELKTVFPVNVVLKTLYLIGSADGISIIFMRTGNEVYAIDLKTYKAKKEYEGRTYSVVAYMSFCHSSIGRHLYR